MLTETVRNGAYIGLINQETSHAQSEVWNVRPRRWSIAACTGSPCRPARTAARPMGRIRKTVCALMTRFLAWRARRETLRLLSSLDAATLRDLGLTDIESAVYGAPQDRMRGYDPAGGRQDGVDPMAASPRPRARGE